MGGSLGVPVTSESSNSLEHPYRRHWDRGTLILCLEGTFEPFKTPKGVTPSSFMKSESQWLHSDQRKPYLLKWFQVPYTQSHTSSGTAGNFQELKERKVFHSWLTKTLAIKMTREVKSNHTFAWELYLGPQVRRSKSTFLREENFYLSYISVPEKWLELALSVTNTKLSLLLTTIVPEGVTVLDLKFDERDCREFSLILLSFSKECI